MKIFRLFATVLMVALCATFVSSCSDDDDDKGETSIVGKWYVTEVYYQNKWISAKDAGYKDAFAQFNKDLTYQACITLDDMADGTYVYKDNVITCTVYMATVTYTIIELKGNNITAELNQEGTKTKFKAERR